MLARTSVQFSYHIAISTPLQHVVRRGAHAASRHGLQRRGAVRRAAV